MSAPLSKELRTKHDVSASLSRGSDAAHATFPVYMSRCALQVGAVPVRKDDEVSVVRGTYKVGSCA